ncbi:MAG: phosphotransferase [bacterium]|nr:phosphotransferase [bacterium]
MFLDRDRHPSDGFCQGPDATLCGPSLEVAGIPIPKCHAAELDPGGGQFLLLLEDLSHCRLGRVGSAEDVELAVSHLAGFHARWWGDARLKQNLWITNSSDPTYSSGRRQLLEGVLTAVEARHADVTPGIVLEAAALIIDLWDRVTPSATSPLTLSHGDFRPGQLFFAGEEGGRFTVSDWQTLCLNSPGSDLARIVVTGLTIRQRRSMDRSLVSHYHARLLAGGVLDLDLDSLWLLLRLAVLDILVTHLTTLLVVDARGEEGILRLGDSVDEALPRAKRLEVYFAQLAAALDDYEIIELMRRQGRRV